MNDFNLREYLKHNPLLKEDAPKFKGSNTFIEDNPYFGVDEIPPSIDHFEISTVIQAIDASNTPEDFFKKLFPKEAGFSMSPSEDIKNFFSYHKPNLKIKGDIMVDVGLMMGADEDEIPVKGKIPAKEFLSLFGKYWETTGEYGGDSDFIYQGLEAHVEDGVLSPEEAGQVMLMYWNDPDMDPDEIEDILNTFK